MHGCICYRIYDIYIYDIDMINHDIEFIDSFLQYLAARLYMLYLES